MSHEHASGEVTLTTEQVVDRDHELARALDLIRDNWEYDGFVCIACNRDRYDKRTNSEAHYADCWVAEEFGFPREGA